MSRVSASQIRVIIASTKTDSELQQIADIASRQVDRLAETSCGSSFSADTLTDIELYLSAHLVALSDRNAFLQSEKFENYSATYQQQNVGDDLMSTTYGQAANMLSDGCLYKMGKERAQVVFFGGA